MSEANYFSPEYMMETQRKVMDSWLGMVQGSFANDDPKAQASQPNFMDTWQEFLVQATQGNFSYFDMAERFSDLSKTGLNSEQVFQDWVQQMTKTFTQMVDSPFPTGDTFSKHPSAYWDLMQDTFSRAFSTSSPFPGDFLRAFRPEGLSRMPGNIQGQLDQFLSTPSLGYTRESQEIHKELGRLMLDYEKAMHGYNTAMAKVGMESLTAFQHRYASEMSGETPPTSLKAVYDLWTKTAEKVYGVYVMTDEYTELYGKLVNCMMAVKCQTAKIADEVFEALNLPTRKEINTLHKRVQDLKREYDFRVSKEIESLKEQIAALSPKKKGSQAKTKAASAQPVVAKAPPAKKKKKPKTKTASVKPATKSKKTSAKMPVKKVSLKAKKMNASKKRGK